MYLHQSISLFRVSYFAISGSVFRYFPLGYSLFPPPNPKKTKPTETEKATRRTVSFQ